MAGKGWFGLPFFSLTPRPEVVSCVLSGGGSRLSFQLGALEYLYEHDEQFRPSIFVGTSAGSILASSLAQSGRREEQVEYLRMLRRIWDEMVQPSDMFTPRPWFDRLSTEGPQWLELMRPLVTTPKPTPKPRPALLPFLRGSAVSPASPVSPDEPPLNPLELALTADPEEQVRSEWSLATLSTIATHLGHIPRLGNDLNTIAKGLESTKSMYRPGPVLVELLQPETFDPARTAASGTTLRIAMVALESGELRFMTEQGKLVDRDNQPLSEESHDLTVGVLASCAIPAVFRPVPIGSETYVDGGARENLPAELAIGHLGAARNYIVSSQTSGVQHRGSMANADLVSVVTRSTEILIDEAGRDELAYAHSAGSIVIYPELTVHDSMTVDPALISINEAYGWLRAAEVHLRLDEEAEARHRRIIESRLRCLQAERDYLAAEEPGRRRRNALRSAKTELRDAVRSASGVPLPPGADEWWRNWERRAEPVDLDPPWLAS
ncbi:Patatin-like phospholipase [Tessaracoccus bendigoensis DSM 12906]|uniref:Patatin-like phospholipase n=1 Tax=Tessaracoccus bendigoensis DSM 12906 TaxID=1123357 RepID=A0A1M6JZR8_9ACTN|nr:patatin-like phospholipase family protein [Tessaracoccus bendigoensis]SHJ52201.1 Patatin-like phospholipase [Tessaracoccus bendigoensis DSM 12906]